jgi:hypothetical protein
LLEVFIVFAVPSLSWQIVAFRLLGKLRADE